MSKQGAIRAGKAYVELFADNSPLLRGLKMGERYLKDWGRKVQAIGLRVMAAGSALAAPLVLSVKEFMNVGDELTTLSARTGMSVEALSELLYAARRTDVEVGDLEAAIRRMNVVIGDAANKSPAAVKALAALGLSAQDLLKLSPEDRFLAIGDALSRYTDVSKRAAVANDIFGRNQAAIMPLFAQGAATVNRYREACRRLGLTMSTEDAQAGDRLKDTLDDLWLVMKRMAFTAGGALAPALGDLAQRATAWLVRAGAWLKQNKGLVISAAKLAVALFGAGAGLVALGLAMKAAGSAVGILRYALSAVGTVLGLLFSPTGLTIVGLAAIGLGIAGMLGYVDKAVSWAGAKFKTLKEDMDLTIGGIRDALIAGDITLAAQILWQGLKVAFLDGTKELRIAIVTFYEWWRIAWEDIQTKLVSGMLTVYYWADKVLTKWAARILRGGGRVAGLFKGEDWTKDWTESIDQAEAEILDMNKGIPEDAQKGNLETHKARLKQIETEGEASIKAAQEAADKARAELNDLLARARNERAAAESGAAPGMPALPDMKGISARVGGAVAGTFQATALWGLGAGTVFDRIAKATEDTARNTKGFGDFRRTEHELEAGY
jgi:hypothetical protein